MAHELEMINGTAQMAYAGETPWHGLGTKVDANVSTDEMMKAAGLDWTVSKHSVYASVKGNYIATGQEALIRDTDNKVLTTVGKGWTPVQNAEAFDFFSEFVEAGDMEMHTAGSLKGGEIVWALGKVKSSFELFGGDKIESYLLFTNPHQYGKSIDIRFTPIRVVCNNTLTLSLSGKKDLMVRLTHRSGFDVEQVKNVLGIANSKMDTYKETAEFLGSKMFTADKLNEYLDEVFPVAGKKSKELSRPAKTVKDLMETQPGAEFAEGSFWQAFNAVTFATDHVLGNTDDTRLYSSWYGPNRNRKMFALEKAIEYAEAA